ncbi:hypothetical protein RB195_024195 [Necator americanus]
MPRISTEIDRLVSTHVLEPVYHSEWAALIVAVQKKNGSIRPCADHSTGLSAAMEQNLLPSPDDIFMELNGGRYFSQLDLAEAYLQLEVNDVPKLPLTINTHCGLYRFNHSFTSSFGVKPAPDPSILKQCMDVLIAGIDGTVAYLDDILVTGRTIEEQNARLEYTWSNKVFKRIQDCGLSFRLDKCASMRTEITYFEYVFKAQGQSRKDESYIEGPKDVSQLRFFLGIINFYGDFVKNLHSLRTPLDTLTKKMLSTHGHQSASSLRQG